MKPSVLRSSLGDRGAIAPFAALMLVPLIGATALATDVGLWYAQRRHLQAAADMAALSAVQNPAEASAIAGDLLQRNGFDTEALETTTLGTYCPDVTIAPSARFVPGLATCPDGTSPPAANAVMVSAKTTVPGFLSRALLQDDGGGQIGGTPGSEEDPNLHKVSVQATAARIDEAGFQAGTGLVEVDTQKSALLNAILGNVLGTQIQLTAVHYQGLLNTNIDALTFLDALAIHADISAGTYDGLLETDVSVGVLLQAAIDALNKAGNIAGLGLQAIEGLVALQGQLVGNPDLRLGDLIDLGVWKNLPIGGSTAPTALAADLNVFQLVTLAVQVANKHNAVYIPAINVGLPGIASLQITATVIEPPQSPPFAFGPEGMRVHTAQVRLQLKLQLLDLFGLLGQGVQLPLYVEAGEGDAVLKDISCGIEPAKETTVTVAAKSGVAKAYIGTLPPGLMKNFDHEISVNDIQPAALVDVGVLGIIGLVRINGRAKVELGSGAYQDLVFDREDIDNHVAQSVASAGMVDNLLASLGGVDPATGKANLQLSACVVSLGGLCLIPVAPEALGKTVGALHQLLDPVIKGLLDPLVDNLLAALGIRLGVMDVVVTGVRCGVPVLIR
ncbi:pilus assembly protein TadG-related protein [Inquilinus limosus]|uniref:pilus assembly protein TadG-related protein n=1 Tax=Inquilinus limosus TaxID=171674 RepID=UPI00040A201E|nr:pilus assembly protein TadG-related protein [Inquilinus limosus]